MTNAPSSSFLSNEERKEKPRKAWVELFKAEYFSTTARFRNNRHLIPLTLTAALILIMFLFRLAFARFIESGAQLTEPTMQIYTVFGVFSYILLFVPLVSPLGKVFFDSTSWKYQDFLASTPIKERDILLGTFLSNLIFFLPFYGLFGTISLSFLVGTNWIPWWAVSLLLLAALSILIVFGLFAGTIITPLVYTVIAKQRNDLTRAMITFALALLMFGGVLLAYLYSGIDSPSELGWLGFLPSSLAANVIIYILYGENYFPGFWVSLSIIIGMFIALIIIGIKFSNQLYTLDQVLENAPKKVRKRTLYSLMYNGFRKIFGKGIAETTLVNFKLGVREIESLARLSLGVSITVFLVYSLLGEHTLQLVGSNLGQFQRAAIFFSLTIGAGSMVYIEAANFIVRHKEIFVLYKSAPYGIVKFLIGKWLQMSIIQSITASFAIVLLLLLNVSQFSLLLEMYTVLVFNIFCISALVIGIYSINPVDNEEDVINMINMLFFFTIVGVFAGVIASQYFFATEDNIGFWSLIWPYIIIFLMSLTVFLLGIIAMEQMDVETLDSPLRRAIITIVAILSIWIISWIILPLIALALGTLLNIFYIGIVVASIIPLLIPLMTKQVKEIFGEITEKNVKSNVMWLLKGVTLLFILNVLFGILITSGLLPEFSDINQIYSQFFPIFQNISRAAIFIAILVLVIVEEIFFRGYTLIKMEKSLGKIGAILGSSVLFALLHFNSLVTIMFSLFAGIILAIVRYKTKSLLSPILVHYFYNITLVSMFFILN